MGLIRKTASIGTLGLINFRSNKEKLAREQDASLQARKDLSKAEADVTALSDKAEKAAKRAEKAELDLLKSEKSWRRRQRWSKRRHSAAGIPDDVANLGRRAGRKARKQAKKAEKATRKQARKAKDTIVDKVA